MMRLWLSVVPILLIVSSLAAVLIAWRSGRRKNRIVVGAALSLIGIVGLLGLLGPTFSIAGGLFIGGVGILLLLAALKSEDAAE
jgi:cyanate permease